MTKGHFCFLCQNSLYQQNDSGVFMRLQWMIIAACLLSSCAFIDGLHNQQQNTSEKPNAQGKILPSQAALPGSINNQNNPTTNAAKTIMPLV